MRVDPVHLVAIYKTFDGDEWLDASLASIYPHVSAIVLVHSNVSWTGKQGNTARDVAIRWKEEHDERNKIHNLDHDTQSQFEQYRAALEYIDLQGIPWEFVMAVDADEIWDDRDLQAAKHALRTDATKRPAYQTQMHTYIKTPFYRVLPTYGFPVTFFRDPSWLTKSPRGCKAPSKLLDNVWFHHLTYVRRSFEAVWEKIQSSCVGDGGERIVPNWREAVWDKLPFAENLHAFHRWRHVWKSVERVWLSDLPEELRQSAGMRRFVPDGQLMDGEQNVLRDLSVGKQKAVDLGTLYGLSAMIMSLGADSVETVDLFEDISAIPTTSDPIGPTYPELWSNGRTRSSVVEQLAVFGNVAVRHCETSLAAEQHADQSVDLLFMDADHSYEGTRANWVAWHPKLKLGGTLLLHDNNELHPGVQRAVRENDRRLFQPITLAGAPGSLACFQRVA